MNSARSALEALLASVTDAVTPAVVAVAGAAPDEDAAPDEGSGPDEEDAEVVITPLALRRVGRSRRDGALLDLELTVAVTTLGPDAIDHLERLLVLAETGGLIVGTPPEPPVLGLTLALPVTVRMDEPTGPRVDTVVVDVRPTAAPGGSPGVPLGATRGASSPAIETSSPPEGS